MCEYPYVHLVPKLSPILNRLSPREEVGAPRHTLRSDAEPL